MSESNPNEGIIIHGGSFTGSNLNKGDNAHQTSTVYGSTPQDIQQLLDLIIQVRTSLSAATDNTVRQQLESELDDIDDVIQSRDTLEPSTWRTRLGRRATALLGFTQRAAEAAGPIGNLAATLSGIASGH
ncbi:hypothetical protein [Streptomyces sp. NBC_01465]|uniref:hypothetical protein n=1 Tax=Streptomyces sp. NBC_01465 TaxID=2903878 RepID=UPI002E3468B8|nr:hypothetical protein [Streptomyces sp. NBC_01465]